ncbi:MAG TPA: hypothetical protein VLY45_04090 [Nitrospiria bacterium]|nr:hypothetical protein [Nitrospiria bacterium]
MAIALWLIPGGLPSASAAPSMQGIFDQIASDAASGQIYGAGTADDLNAMLNSINSYLASGDTITAKSLLDGFVNAVHQMSDVLMTTTAANQLITMANSLSLNL